MGQSTAKLAVSLKLCSPIRSSVEFCGVVRGSGPSPFCVSEYDESVCRFSRSGKFVSVDIFSARSLSTKSIAYR